MISSAPIARNFSAMPLPSPVPPPVTRMRLPRNNPSVNMRLPSWRNVSRISLRAIRATRSLASPRRASLAEVPIEPGHQPQALAGEPKRQMLVGRMLGAARIGMRHPDGRQPEQLREYIVGQGAARARQDRGLLARGARDRGRRPLRPPALWDHA